MTDIENKKRQLDTAGDEVVKAKKQKKDKKEKKSKKEVVVEPVVEKKEKKSKKEKKEKKENKSEDVVASKEKKTVLPTAEIPIIKDTGIKSSWYTENNVAVIGSSYLEPCLEFKNAPFPQYLNDYIVSKPGFVTPSGIQASAWPQIMKGNCVFGIAKTGSGKTLAFTLPFIAKSELGLFTVPKKHTNKPRMVCVAPTKELAQQIADVTKEFAQNKICKNSYPTVCIIGGVPKWEQRKNIDAGCDICVATPGRLLDLVENDQMLDLSEVQFLVLDEADRMLDMGFIQDMRKLAQYCPEEKRQTMLFSATWPAEVSRLARSLIAKNKIVATVTVGRKGDTDAADGEVDKLQLNPDIKQEVIVIDNNRLKWNLLIKTLEKNLNKKTLIFGLYKKEVANIEQWLNQSGYKCVGLHGDMTQVNRQAALDSFKSSKVNMLVATDVAGRGIDISDIGLVINYTFPLTIEDFVHRTGRTGRAGKKGHAITFFNTLGEHKELDHCFDICRLIEGAKQLPPPALKDLAKNTFVATKKKSHGMYGNFFKSEEEMAKLNKKKVAMTFDSDSE